MSLIVHVTEAGEPAARVTVPAVKTLPPLVAEALNRPDVKPAASVAAEPIVAMAAAASTRRLLRDFCICFPSDFHSHITVVLVTFTRHVSSGFPPERHGNEPEQNRSEQHAGHGRMMQRVHDVTAAADRNPEYADRSEEHTS